jgi:hypothetical protein
LEVAVASDFYWNGQDIRDRTFELACAVVNLADVMYGHGGAARTIGAENLKDFISKLCIALKEARETVVRLRICHRTQRTMASACEPLIRGAYEITAIIGAIVRNNRAKLRAAKAASGAAADAAC